MIKHLKYILYSLLKPQFYFVGGCIIYTILLKIAILLHKMRVVSNIMAMAVCLRSKKRFSNEKLLILEVDYCPHTFRLQERAFVLFFTHWPLATFLIYSLVQQMSTNFVMHCLKKHRMLKWIWIKYAKIFEKNIRYCLGFDG